MSWQTDSVESGRQRHNPRVQQMRSREDLEDARYWELMRGNDQQRFNDAMAQLDRANGFSPSEVAAYSSEASSIAGGQHASAGPFESTSLARNATRDITKVRVPVGTDLSLERTRERLCPCCGEEVTGRPNKVYVNSRHRWRHSKRRLSGESTAAKAIG